jgi:hypothetical protein
MNDAESRSSEWGPEWHRREQLRAWARATPAQRFAWLEEMLDWLRARDSVKRDDPDRKPSR